MRPTFKKGSKRTYRSTRSRFGNVRVKVDARRARKKTAQNEKYPFLDLDFVDDKPHDLRTRVLYGLAAIACVIGALIGAVLPVMPAIPLWIMAAICLSHAFPVFGRWLRQTRLYRWLLSKLNEPVSESSRPVMTHRLKNQVMTAITAVLAALILLAWRLLPTLPLPISLPSWYMWVVSILVSLGWVSCWLILYFYVREPEATIRMARSESATQKLGRGRKRAKREKRAAKKARKQAQRQAPKEDGG